MVVPRVIFLIVLIVVAAKGEEILVDIRECAVKSKIGQDTLSEIRRTVQIPSSPTEELMTFLVCIYEKQGFYDDGISYDAIINAMNVTSNGDEDLIIDRIQDFNATEIVAPCRDLLFFKNWAAFDSATCIFQQLKEKIEAQEKARRDMYNI